MKNHFGFKNMMTFGLFIPALLPFVFTFSVGETKNPVTFSQKVHRYGSVIGFMILTLAALQFA